MQSFGHFWFVFVPLEHFFCFLAFMDFDSDEDSVEETVAKDEDVQDDDSDIDPVEEFALLEILEEGTGSTIFRAQHKVNNETYVVKVLEFGEAADQAYHTLKQEVAQLMQLAQVNPLVVGYYGLYRRATSIWIVEEFCEGGSALDASILLESLTEDQIEALVHGAILALLKLHSQGFIHANLRASNVLLCEDGEVKIADFGQLGLLKRSSYWLSPEFIENNENVSDKSDVWSLGITCIEMAEHLTPYHEMGAEESMQLIVKGPIPELEDKDRWSPEFHTFIAACLQRDPMVRPSPQELLKHPFLADIADSQAQSTVRSICKQFGEKRKMWNVWAQKQAEHTGQQVTLLPLCQIKELFYSRMMPEEEEEEEEDGSPGRPKPTTSASPDGAGKLLEIVDQEEQNIVKGPKECDGRVCVLKKLDNCEVHMVGLMESVKVVDCVECTLVLGPCVGEVLFSQCENMEITCAAQSVRLQDCRDCNVFTCVMQPPIVDHCSGMIVGPWNISIAGAKALFASAGLIPGRNQYRNVQDLSRDATEIPTPHFSVLEPDDLEEPMTITIPGLEGPAENPCDPATNIDLTESLNPPPSGPPVKTSAHDYDDGDFDSESDEDAAAKTKAPSHQTDASTPGSVGGAKTSRKALGRFDDDNEFEESGEEDAGRQGSNTYDDDGFDSFDAPPPQATAVLAKVKQAADHSEFDDSDEDAAAAAADDKPAALRADLEQMSQAAQHVAAAYENDFEDDFPADHGKAAAGEDDMCEFEPQAPEITVEAPHTPPRGRALHDYDDEFDDESPVPTPTGSSKAGTPSAAKPKASDDSEDEFEDERPTPTKEGQKTPEVAKVPGDYDDEFEDEEPTPTKEDKSDAGRPSATKALDSYDDDFDGDFDDEEPMPPQSTVSNASVPSPSKKPTKALDSYDDEFDDEEESPAPTPTKSVTPTAKAPSKALDSYDDEFDDEKESPAPTPTKAETPTAKAPSKALDSYDDEFDDEEESPAPTPTKAETPTAKAPSKALDSYDDEFDNEEESPAPTPTKAETPTAKAPSKALDSYDDEFDDEKESPAPTPTKAETPTAKAPSKALDSYDDEFDDEEESPAPTPTKAETPTAKAPSKALDSYDDEFDNEEESPAPTPTKAETPTAKAPSKALDSYDDEFDDEKESPAPTPTKAETPTAKAPSKALDSYDDEFDDEEESPAPTPTKAETPTAKAPSKALDSYDDEFDNEEESPAPTPTKAETPTAKAPSKALDSYDDEFDDEEESPAPTPTKAETPTAKAPSKALDSYDDEFDDEEESPAPTPTKAETPTAKAPSKALDSYDDEFDDEEESPAPTPTKSVTPTAKAPSKALDSYDDEFDDEEESPAPTPTKAETPTAKAPSKALDSYDDEFDDEEESPAPTPTKAETPTAKAPSKALDSYDDEFDDEEESPAPTPTKAETPTAKAPSKALDSYDDEFDDEKESPAPTPTKAETPTAKAPSKALDSYDDEFDDEEESPAPTPTKAETPTAKAPSKALDSYDDEFDDEEESPAPTPTKSDTATPSAENQKALHAYDDEFEDFDDDQPIAGSPGQAGLGPAPLMDVVGHEEEDKDDDEDGVGESPVVNRSQPLGSPDLGAPPAVAPTVAAADQDEDSDYDDEFDEEVDEDLGDASGTQPTANAAAAPKATTGSASFDDSDEDDDMPIPTPAGGRPSTPDNRSFNAPSDAPSAATSDAPSDSVAAIRDTPATQPLRLGHKDDSDSDSCSDASQQESRQASTPIIPASGSVNRGPQLVRLKGQQIVRMTGSVSGDVLQMAQLEDCKVYILDVVRSAVLQDCIGCTIVVGPTTTSLSILGCQGCNITAAGREVTLKDCQDLRLHLYSSAGPSLSDCNGIVINTWNCAFSGCSDLFRAANLDPAANKYRSVNADAASTYSLGCPNDLKVNELTFDEGEEIMEDDDGPEMPAALKALLDTPVAQAASTPAEAPAQVAAPAKPSVADDDWDSEDGELEVEGAKPAALDVDDLQAPAPAVLPDDEKLTCVKGKTDRTIVRYKGLEAQQMALDRLQGCTIKLFGMMDSVLVDDCYDCTFIIGPTTGSVMFRDCKNLKIAAACQQLRTRDCQDLQLYLYCNTDPVVETSFNIRFQTWNLAYPELKSLFAAARLNPARNRYQNVFDFNKGDESIPEPHFTVQPIDGSLKLQEEWITDFQDRKLECGPPEIPDALLQMLRGELAPPTGKDTEDDQAHDEFGHMDIRMGQQAAQAMVDAVDEDGAPKPRAPANFSKDAMYDDVFELDDDVDDVEDEAHSDVDMPNSTPVVPESARPSSEPEIQASDYIPRFAMAGAEYQSALQRVREMEVSLKELHAKCAEKARSVDALLHSILSS